MMVDGSELLFLGVDWVGLWVLMLLLLLMADGGWMVGG